MLAIKKYFFYDFSVAHFMTGFKWTAQYTHAVWTGECGGYNNSHTIFVHFEMVVCDRAQQPKRKAQRNCQIGRSDDWLIIVWQLTNILRHFDCISLSFQTCDYDWACVALESSRAYFNSEGNEILP